MKKTTYILIALVCAGLIFAFLFPMALVKNSSKSEYVDLMTADSPQRETVMPDFSNLRIACTETDTLTGLSHCQNVVLTVEAADSSATATTLSVPEIAFGWISIEETADTVTLRVTPSEDAVKELQRHPMMNLTIPLTIRMPHNRLRSLTCLTSTNLHLKGIHTDSISVYNANGIGIDSCRLNSLRMEVDGRLLTGTYASGLNLGNSLISDVYISTPYICHINGDETSGINTLLTDTPSGGITLSLHDIRIGSMQFTPNDGRMIDLQYSNNFNQSACSNSDPDIANK